MCVCADQTRGHRVSARRCWRHRGAHHSNGQAAWCNVCVCVCVCACMFLIVCVFVCLLCLIVCSCVVLILCVCRVIATVSTDDKAKIARASGADHVILYTKQDFYDEVMKITNKKGVHCVYGMKHIHARTT